LAPFGLLKFEMLLPAFGLVLARVSGLLLAVPMFSSEQIPRAAKVWLAVMLSVMVFPAVAATLPPSLTLGQAASGMVGEFVIGEILGLGLALIFVAAEVAGKAVSHQSGMALGEVFNPVMDTTMTVLDEVWFFVVLMIFLALRGHLAAVEAVLESFRHVPPMMLAADLSLVDYVVGLMQSTFETALRLAGPAILARLLTSLVLGFLTKTMPQLNVLSVGFSFKIATALVMVAVTISYSGDLMADAMFDGLDQIGLLFEHLSRASLGS